MKSYYRENGQIKYIELQEKDIARKVEKLRHYDYAALERMYINGNSLIRAAINRIIGESTERDY